MIVIGSMALGLGAIGVVLPLLPTTPFLLLAAGAFFRSSPRLYNWVIGNKVFGKLIYNYREHRAIPLKGKILALFSLWGVMSLTIIFFVDVLWLRLLLVAVAVGVTIHLLTFKTLKEEKTL